MEADCDDLLIVSNHGYGGSSSSNNDGTDHMLTLTTQCSSMVCPFPNSALIMAVMNGSSERCDRHLQKQNEEEDECSA